MEVIVIGKSMNYKNKSETKEENIPNVCPETESTNTDVKNDQTPVELEITEKDLYNNLQFNKARAIRSLIMNMMALKPITDNEATIDAETFESYVNIGEKIDRCFDNLMTEFIENNESDDCDCEGDCTECDEYCEKCGCSLECDIECGECERCAEECGLDDEFDDCDDEEDNYFNNVIKDMAVLVKALKPMFNDNIDDNTGSIYLDVNMTSEEYTELKNIFDKYEVVNSLRVKE